VSSLSSHRRPPVRRHLADRGPAATHELSLRAGRKRHSRRRKSSPLDEFLWDGFDEAQEVEAFSVSFDQPDVDAVVLVDARSCHVLVIE
jgi:hypothetical protein